MSDSRAARRKLLLDRWTEILTEAGDPHAEERAWKFFKPMDELGFALPAAIDDSPPMRPAHVATDAQRRARLAEIGQTLSKRDTPTT